jgi:hypothetical protein
MPPVAQTVAQHWGYLLQRAEVAFYLNQSFSPTLVHAYTTCSPGQPVWFFPLLQKFICADIPFSQARILQVPMLSENFLWLLEAFFQLFFLNPQASLGEPPSLSIASSFVQETTRMTLCIGPPVLLDPLYAMLRGKAFAVQYLKHGFDTPFDATLRTEVLCVDSVLMKKEACVLLRQFILQQKWYRCVILDAKVEEIIQRFEPAPRFLWLVHFPGEAITPATWKLCLGASQFVLTQSMLTMIQETFILRLPSDLKHISTHKRKNLPSSPAEKKQKQEDPEEEEKTRE